MTYPIDNPLDGLGAAPQAPAALPPIEELLRMEASAISRLGMLLQPWDYSDVMLYLWAAAGEPAHWTPGDAERALEAYYDRLNGTGAFEGS